MLLYLNDPFDSPYSSVIHHNMRVVGMERDHLFPDLLDGDIVVLRQPLGHYRPTAGSTTAEHCPRVPQIGDVEHAVRDSTNEAA